MEAERAEALFAHPRMNIQPFGLWIPQNLVEVIVQQKATTNSVDVSEVPFWRSASKQGTPFEVDGFREGR